VTAPQEKDWAVMTAADQVTVDEKRRAQVTFTVTNLQREAASVTTTVVADDVAARWFALDQPVRYVNPGDSSQVQVRVLVPETAPAADYSFQLLAYSTDTAPEEKPTYSSRVLLRVPARPVRPRRFKLILLIAGIAFIVASLVTTLAVVLVTREPEALPTATPSAPEVVRVPSVHGLTDLEAISAILSEVGLVADITYVHNLRTGGVVGQEPAPLEEVTPGSVVAVYYAVTFTPPTDLRVTATVHPALIPAQDGLPWRMAADVEISWQQSEDHVQSWQVVFASNVCINLSYEQFIRITDAMVVDTTTVRVTRHFTPMQGDFSRVRVSSCPGPHEFVYVAPVDGLGQAGPYLGAEIRTPYHDEYFYYYNYLW
jgi:hypothetical protein